MLFTVTAIPYAREQSNLKERAEKLEQQQEEALKNRRVEETGFRDQEEVAVLIQSIIRGFLARQRTAQLSLLRQVHRMKEKVRVSWWMFACRLCDHCAAVILLLF